MILEAKISEGGGGGGVPEVSLKFREFVTSEICQQKREEEQKWSAPFQRQAAMAVCVVHPGRISPFQGSKELDFKPLQAQGGCQQPETPPVKVVALLVRPGSSSASFSSEPEISVVEVRKTESETQEIEVSFVGTKSPHLYLGGGDEMAMATCSAAAGASSLFWNFPSPFPSKRSKPQIPAIVFCGGAGLSGGRPQNIRILCLLDMDPFDLTWSPYSTAAPPVSNAKSASESEFPDFPCVREGGDGDGGGGGDGDWQPQQKMSLRDRLIKTRAPWEFADDQRSKYKRQSAQVELSLSQPPEWARAPTFSPGYLIALSTTIVWPFTAIGNLIENSASLTVRTTHMAFDFGFGANGTPFFCVSDNGRGLSYTGMQRLLKEYGNWSRMPEGRDRTKRSASPAYGLGFKLAIARLADNALVITKTRGSVGFGMLSGTLDYHANSDSPLVPIVYWKIPSRALMGYESKLFKAAHHAQSLIYSYSPFKTPEALSEQINALKDGTGTRVILWNFKTSLPSHLTFDRLPPHKIRNCNIPTMDARLAPGEEFKEMLIGADCFPLRPKSNVEVSREIIQHGAAGGNGAVELKARINDKVYALSTSTAGCSDGGGKASLLLSGLCNSNNAFSSSSSPATWSALPRLRFADYMFCPEQLSQRYRSALSETEKLKENVTEFENSNFPFWSTAEDSIDYSLDVFVYWSQLFSPLIYWVHGLPLLPLNGINGGTPDEDGTTTTVKDKDRQHQPPVPSAGSTSRDSPPEYDTSSPSSSPTISVDVTTDEPAGGGASSTSSRKKRLLMQVPTTVVKSSKKRRGNSSAAPVVRGTESENHKGTEIQTTTAPLADHNNSATTEGGGGGGGSGGGGGGRLIFSSALGVESPAEFQAPEHPNDPFRHSLGRYLKIRLNLMVELDYLFSPEDSQQGAWGLLGFVNSPGTLCAVKSSDESPLRFQETGILLYHRERLVRRLFVPFPASAGLLTGRGRRKYPSSHFEGSPEFLFPCSAVINVPDWIFPTVTKDQFVCERSPVFELFCQKMKQLISQYLRVCRDENRRLAWVRERKAKLLDYLGAHHPLSLYYNLACFQSAIKSGGGGGGGGAEEEK